VTSEGVEVKKKTQRGANRWEAAEMQCGGEETGKKEEKSEHI